MTSSISPRTFVAFAGDRLVSSGDVEATLRGAKRYLDSHADATVLVFEDQTGAQIDFDWRGTTDEVLARLKEHPMFAEDKAHVGPGRPKLGVVSREVSLLPRHWQWLEAQSGGISAALRRLVDDARKAHPQQEEASRMRDAMSRFMWAVAGNFPGFEEASRALFASDAGRFGAIIATWPEDVRQHLLRLGTMAFGPPGSETRTASSTQAF